MKKNISYVSVAKATAIATHLKCNVVEQKGFVKVTFGEHDDRRVYIGNGKGCGRIDISGFIHELGIEHDSPPTSKVVQMVDQRAGRTEIEILKDLARIIKDGLVDRLGEAVTGKRAAGKTVAEPSQAEIDDAVLIACGG